MLENYRRIAINKGALSQKRAQDELQIDVLEKSAKKVIGKNIDVYDVKSTSKQRWNYYVSLQGMTFRKRKNSYFTA